MSSLIIVLFVILSLFLTPKTEEINSFDCWVYKNDNGNYVKSPNKPLGYYIDSIIYHTDYAWLFNNDYIRFDSMELGYNIDTIGYLNNRLTVELHYSVYGQHKGEGKIVLLEDKPKLFRILYMYPIGNTVHYDKSARIVIIDNSTILYVKNRSTGQDLSYEEKYWVWPLESDCPCELNQNKYVRTVFKNAIPFEYRYYLFFSIDSLYAGSWIWKMDDHPNWATGGFIKLWYEINGCDLTIIKHEYDSSRIASH